MGLRLRILCWWTPNWVLRRELDRVSQVTTSALKSLLATYNDKKQTLRVEWKTQNSKTIEEKRSKMAAEHTMLVEELKTLVGQDKALTLGREAMFKVGKRLGVETRDKLGVSSDNPKDLIRAATILYRVLGIEFKAEWSGTTQVTLIINRCALSQKYTEFTCKVLSATDEGVINGLNPNMTMAFTQNMTSGCKECKAKITVKTDGGT